MCRNCHNGYLDELTLEFCDCAQGRMLQDDYDEAIRIEQEERLLDELRSDHEEKELEEMGVR